MLTTFAVVMSPSPASADEGDLNVVLLWVRCQDQSEPASDEPYVLVNGVQVASATNIDPGDKFYFLGEQNARHTFPAGGYLYVELWEDDGIWGDDHLGTFVVPYYYQGAGEMESYVFGNGEYILRFVVT